MAASHTDSHTARWDYGYHEDTTFGTLVGLLCGVTSLLAYLLSAIGGRADKRNDGFGGVARPAVRRPRWANWQAQNRAGHRLAVLAIERKPGLRIDYCTSCRGYLKTYNGHGNEPLLLADWAFLHLDVLAQDYRLKRLAASMYDL